MRIVLLPRALYIHFVVSLVPAYVYNIVYASVRGAEHSHKYVYGT